MNWVSIPGGRYDLLEGGIKNHSAKLKFYASKCKDEGDFSDH